MTITRQELEILVYENALRSQAGRVLRAERAFVSAGEELRAEKDALQVMEEVLSSMREQYLKGAV